MTVDSRTRDRALSARLSSMVGTDPTQHTRWLPVSLWNLSGYLFLLHHEIVHIFKNNQGHMTNFINCEIWRHIKNTEIAPVVYPIRHSIGFFPKLEILIGSGMLSRAKKASSQSGQHLLQGPKHRAPSYVRIPQLET